jgi:hypothetical protein
MAKGKVNHRDLGRHILSAYIYTHTEEENYKL